MQTKQVGVSIPLRKFRKLGVHVITVSRWEVSIPLRKFRKRRCPMQGQVVMAVFPSL